MYLGERSALWRRRQAQRLCTAILVLAAPFIAIAIPAIWLFDRLYQYAYSKPTQRLVVEDSAGVRHKVS